MDSVRNQLRSIAPEAFFVTVPTHDFVGKEGRKLIEASRVSVVGGTNLLSSEVNKYNQWKVSWRDMHWLKNVILMGVGWWQYQPKPNIRTKIFLNSVLHQKFYHSVRDEYTLSQLKLAGLSNACNTSCVTLWDLDAEKQSVIPFHRSDSVVTTVTDYKPAPDKDKAFLNLLKIRYNKVYLWLQGLGDYDYFRSLNISGIEIIDPHLATYDELLDSSIDLDYVGTRLHAGIRAMKYGRRSIILGVDNRAQEIGCDTGLKVHLRDDGVEKLDTLIAGEYETCLSLPWGAIGEWRMALRAELGLSSIANWTGSS
jgi:polysaccharide pyruvyl transferase WcaK-like protein